MLGSRRFLRLVGPSLVAVALAAGVFLAVGVQADEPPQGPAPAAAAAVPDVVARGAYIVTISGCDDCHTPKVMGPHGPELDMSRRLSGHPEGSVLQPASKVPEGWIALTNDHLTAWQGPWGRTYAFNLTPDENTGIGIWTEEMFVSAIRTGRHMGQSRPIMPPMPWQNFAQMTDEDLHAVWTFLRSLPPIVNRVPEYEPASAEDPEAAPDQESVAAST